MPVSLGLRNYCTTRRDCKHNSATSLMIAFDEPISLEKWITDHDNIALVHQRIQQRSSRCWRIGKCLFVCGSCVTQKARAFWPWRNTEWNCKLPVVWPMVVSVVTRCVDPKRCFLWMLLLIAWAVPPLFGYQQKTEMLLNNTSLSTPFADNTQRSQSDQAWTCTVLLATRGHWRRVRYWLFWRLARTWKSALYLLLKTVKHWSEN